MPSNLTPAQVESLRSLPEWQALEEHIKAALVQLDRCSDIPDGPDFDRVARGRKEAIRTIEHILEPFSEVLPVWQHQSVDMARKLGLAE